MSLTTLCLMAAAIGTVPASVGVDFASRKPIDQRGTASALAVRIGGLRSHEETRGPIGDINDVGISWRNRWAKSAARKARMAAKRRRGWR